MYNINCCCVYYICLKQFAEEMGLEHVSSGSGNARFIQITKTATSPPNEQQPFGVEDEDMPAKQKKKKEKSTLETPSSGVCVQKNITVSRCFMIFSVIFVSA